MHSVVSLQDRRRFLAHTCRFVAASLIVGPISALARSSGAAAGPGSLAPLLAAGNGAISTEAVFLRGCSALSTGVAGVGGALPRGLAVDFRRSIACLVGGVDRRTIEVRSTENLLAAAPGDDWAVVAIGRDASRRSWHARIGDVMRRVGRETATR
jgi:hypothetical protein